MKTNSVKESLILDSVAFVSTATVSLRFVQICEGQWKPVGLKYGRKVLRT